MRKRTHPLAKSGAASIFVSGVPPAKSHFVSAATSERRRPQPRSTARIARSRSPFVVVASGAFRSAWACASR